ncbi:hypothetical protein SPRG_13567 [Saprolegnia parasitica CBS 223.65]|uniref:Uncharacterized protein n=1 Tax=Saprolegnia parasitica (strain CBS 223.65) TaxID=695850 RepID=A0A067BSP8_SAPPC|nr:hypothetical protein SPRG_13567 [Saprolegnia parasitica CBS 223.65]KDO21268.1 hypothetical protein SPRG_13567 [Saprolegnia parasitica CBS 223.65]|eukprot:XP_012208012.1 hypothetical protein SPRG_13567 [Saprolegnia parasitica CBS 223.65]
MGFFTSCFRESSAIVPTSLVRDCVCRSSSKRLLRSTSSLFKFRDVDEVDLNIKAQIRHRFVEWPAARTNVTVVGGRRVPFTLEDLYHAKMEQHQRSVLCTVPEDDHMRCEYCEEPIQFTKAAAVVWIALTQVQHPLPLNDERRVA